MTIEQFGNFGQTTLSAAIAAGATTVPVAALKLPTPSTNSPVRVTIDAEVFLLTGVSGNNYTGLGGQEGTTAAAHASGAIVDHGVTAAHMQALPLGGRAVTGNDTLAATDNYLFVSLTGAATITINPAALIAFKDYKIKDWAGNFDSCNLTLALTSGLIEGLSSIVLSTPRESITLFTDGTNIGIN